MTGKEDEVASMTGARDLPVETDRLVVRRFRPDDWQDLHAYLSLPQTYRFEPGEPVDDAQARAVALERSRGRAFWAVVLRAERRMIGHLYLAQVEPADLRTYELGYIFNPAFHGHGYATEAADALVRHAFAVWDAHRVIALCNPDNTASWRLLERIGFVREGHLRRNVFFRRDDRGNPIWQDTYEYGRTDDGDLTPSGTHSGAGNAAREDRT
jgi:ribosomal-protein-alanine N-acetyltransferase